MVNNRITIGKEEFVKRILDGERDFRKIIMKQGSEGNFNRYSLYPELLKYLKKQDLKTNPLCIEDSVFAWVRAQGLYFPHVKAQRAKFIHCKISFSNFSHGDFKEGVFGYSRLEGVRFDGADLSEAIFYGNSDTILAGHNLSFRGRPIIFEDPKQEQFERNMILGAYSKSGECRRGI